MNPSHEFESLAGVGPGSSTVGEAVARFGPPTVSETSDGGLFFSFEGCGVHLIVYRDQRIAADPLISEVRLTLPSSEGLPCGIRIGQPQADALDAVRRTYQITAEYEDAVYFRSSVRDDLLASVEFLSTGVVVSVELMHQLASAPDAEPGAAADGRGA